MAKLLFESLNIPSNQNCTITDATSGNAGNTIHFSFIFKKVIAIEISKLHYNICKNNLESYKEAQNTESEKMLRMMEVLQDKKKKDDED